MDTGETSGSVVTRTYPKYPYITRLFHYVIHYVFLILRLS